MDWSRKLASKVVLGVLLAGFWMNGFVAGVHFMRHETVYLRDDLFAAVILLTCMACLRIAYKSYGVSKP
jgi:hypothetical protein